LPLAFPLKGTVAMTSGPAQPALGVASPADLLAVIPPIFGFVPDSSLVVLGATKGRRYLQAGFRYTLPDPPDPSLTADIAAHAAGVLASQHLANAIAVGYGPGRLVTPLADELRRVLPAAGISVPEMLRVEAGRYWSYLCHDPACCPPEGVPFDTSTLPQGGKYAALGLALPSREALAATIAPVTGTEAQTMAEATVRAEQAAALLTGRHGISALEEAGLRAVQAAIGLYRGGGSLPGPTAHAMLALVLRRVRVRDDAWARMDPAHRRAHQWLWTDLARHVQPGYVAAPACLLAVTAWQAGQGALASIALERALADEPGYSMALLLREAIAAGMPPSQATPPMTPGQVAASYRAKPEPPAPGGTPPGTG
jgi:hypothetical protein